MQSTLETIAASLGLKTPDNRIIDTLLTDSRNLTNPESTLFFAINNPEGNDGHAFMRPLYDAGVRAFVANRVPDNMRDADDALILLVDDSVLALQRIVAATSRPHIGETVAITGSRGKTTLKEWIFQLMEPLCKISRSPRSYNSQIGVPLSLWSIDGDTDVAIIEAGVSKAGEMARLRECIAPDTVILTNIGAEHADGFHSDAEKAAEKLTLAKNAKTIIFNKDSKLIADAVAPIAGGKKTIAWSMTDPDADILIRPDRASLPDGTEIPFGVTLSGLPDIENTANAVAFMLHRGVSPQTITERLGKLHKIGTRLNVSEGVNGCSLIFDSYTSDLSSLAPAIHFMMRRKTPGQRSTLIMSDILHETSDTDETYRAIARIVRETGIDNFIGVGPEMVAHSHLFKEGSRFFPATDSLLASLNTSDFVNEIILMKGAPDFSFSRINELLEARKHETVLEVNLDAVVRNYNYFRSHLPKETGIVAMVKASGYGAGSYEIAKTLQDSGAAYLAVAVLDEGIDLRRNGISMPIMVMNPKVVNYRSMFANRLEPEIYSMEMLRDVAREAEKNGLKGYPIHLKLDTGMHRMGFIADELEEVCRIVNSHDSIKMASIFSHLATADCLDMDDYTELQLARFKEMTEFIMARLPYPVKRHVLNSAGILRFAKDHHYDMARLGIGLYGANTLPEEVEKPLSVVSTLRTVIVAIREWEAGETIGYGRRGKLTRKSRIATIPIGYADGMNRHFGRGNISVKVNGKDAPTVGNICMDACMIDVTDIDCRVGDAVEIFGQQAPLQRLADLLDTIPYEVLTSVSPRVKRVYYRE